MERRNAWLSYKEAEETEMEKLAKAYREFLDKGKTERECVAEIVKEAEAAGYESLESKLEKGEKIKAGDKVYAVGMKKIVALFHVGTEELENQVIHCILAHHGELEYGSPKKPALAEAVALNLADNTDARMETLTEIFHADKGKKEWLGFNRLFESNLRRTGDI